MRTYGDISPAMAAWTTAQMVTNQWASSQTIPVPFNKDPIEQADDATLILELVKRGYAVGRLNENNQLDV